MQQRFIRILAPVTVALWAFVIVHGLRVYFDDPPLPICAGGEAGILCARDWLGGVGATLIGLATLIILRRQTSIMADQHKLSEWLAKTDLVRRLVETTAQINTDTNVAYSQLQSICDALEMGDTPVYREARSRFLGDPALRSLQSSGSAELNRRLTEAIRLLNANSSAQHGSQREALLAIMHALVDEVLMNAYEAKAGYEGTYEGMLGTPIPRTARDSWDEAKARRTAEAAARDAASDQAKK